MPVTLSSLGARLGLSLLPEARQEYDDNLRTDWALRLIPSYDDERLLGAFNSAVLGLENTILTIRIRMLTNPVLADRGEASDELDRLLLGGVNLAYRLGSVDVILAEADRRGLTGLREQLAARVAEAIGDG